jgi:signal transduction histidine kinase
MSGGGAGERVGLVSMRQRAAWLGGQCTVESRSGAGTRVLVEVPLPACGGGAWGLRRSHASVRFPHAS